MNDVRKIVVASIGVTLGDNRTDDYGKTAMFSDIDNRLMNIPIFSLQ